MSKILKMLLACGLLGLMELGAAHAQTTVQTVCSPFGSDGQWPPYSATKSCAGSGTPVGASYMRQALQNMQFDPTARLSGLKLQSNDVVSIVVYDDNLPNGNATVSHTINSNTDSSYSIMQDLASQIRNLPSGALFAWATGPNQVTISGDSTTSFQPTVTNGTSGTDPQETVTVADLGDNSYTVTLNAPINMNTWFDFANQTDFRNASSADIPNASSASISDTDGTYYYDWGGQYGYTAIFENGNNKIGFVTAHESGHVLDRLYGVAFVGGSFPHYSAGSYFVGKMQIDLAGINGGSNQPFCKFQVTDNQGYTGDQPGLMTGLTDSKGNYICNADANGNPGQGTSRTADYEGLDQASLIAKAWPRFAPAPLAYADDGATHLARGDLFANLSAYGQFFTDAVNDDGTAATSDINVNGSSMYACTFYAVQRLVQDGKEGDPIDFAFPAYIVVDGSGGSFGPGYTAYYCDGTSSYSLYHFAT